MLAIALDLIDEARARSAAGALATARRLYRMRDVTPALEALSVVGIAAFARTRRYRTLVQLFAPYAPVEIVVPADRLGEAEGICARVVDSAARGAVASDRVTPT